MNRQIIKRLRPGHNGKVGKIIPMPTQAQMQYVRGLEAEINCKGGKVAAEQIVSRTWHKPIKYLNYFQMQGLIEALKSIRENPMLRESPM